MLVKWGLVKSLTTDQIALSDGEGMASTNLTSKRLQRFLSPLAIAACLAVGMPLTAIAQGLPGLTIFSGVERDNILGYRLDFGGRPDSIDRYRLRIPARKMKLAVSQFAITYPDYYGGRFDTERVELRVNGDEVAVDEVVWDQDNRSINIYPQEPVPADSRVEIWLSNVRNPGRAGTFYFNALVSSPGEIPLPRYLGTWILSIGNQ